MCLCIRQMHRVVRKCSGSSLTRAHTCTHSLCCGAPKIQCANLLQQVVCGWEGRAPTSLNLSTKLVHTSHVSLVAVVGTAENTSRATAHQRMAAHPRHRRPPSDVFCLAWRRSRMYNKQKERLWQGVAGNTQAGAQQTIGRRPFEVSACCCWPTTYCCLPWEGTGAVFIRLGWLGGSSWVGEAATWAESAPLCSHSNRSCAR